VNRKWLIVSLSFVRAFASLAIGLESSGFWSLLGLRLIACITSTGTSPAIAGILTGYFFKYGKMGYANSMTAVANSIGASASAFILTLNLEVG
jgi:hypothetical protein